MEAAGDVFSAVESHAIPVDPTFRSSDAVRISEVKAWLASLFETAGREVPDFEYTPRSVAQIHALASLSQSRSRAASIVADDLRLKAAEYRAQASRIREIVDCAGLSQEHLTPNAIFSVQTVASVANLLNIRDTESNSFIAAMGDLSLQKANVDEKRAKVQMNSKALLEYTRKAIAKLNDLKKTFIKFESEVDVHEAQVEHWQRNIDIMDSKERQYMLQLNNYKALLNRIGYTSEINHGVLMEMAEHKKDLEKKTKPILDTLRSYLDLPPDKALAALTIEEKKRQYSIAEKYLEEVLHSTLSAPKI